MNTRDYPQQFLFFIFYFLFSLRGVTIVKHILSLMRKLLTSVSSVIVSSMFWGWLRSILKNPSSQVLDQLKENVIIHFRNPYTIYINTNFHNKSIIYTNYSKCYRLILIRKFLWSTCRAWNQNQGGRYQISTIYL